MEQTKNLPREKRKNFILTILGRKGSGKSTLARKILQEHKKVVVLDTLGEYGEDEGLIVKETFKGCVRAIQKLHSSKYYGVSCRILEPELALLLIELCFNVGDMVLVVEETSMYCTPTILPQAVARCLRYGRHQRLSQIYIARRPAEVNREVTAQSDTVICLQQREPRDIAYMRALMGPEAEKIRDLPLYSFVVYGDEKNLPPEILLDKARVRL